MKIENFWCLHLQNDWPDPLQQVARWKLLLSWLWWLVAGSCSLAHFHYYRSKFKQVERIWCLMMSCYQGNWHHCSVVVFQTASALQQMDLGCMHLSSSPPKRLAPCSLAVLPEKSMFNIRDVKYRSSTSVWMKHSLSDEHAPELHWCHLPHTWLLHNWHGFLWISVSIHYWMMFGTSKYTVWD